VARSDALHTLRVSEAVGAGPRLISFADGAHCEVHDRAGLDAMLTASGFRDGWVVRVQRSWRWAGAALAITLTALLTGYVWGLPLLSEWLAWRLPERALAQIGDTTLQAFDAKVFTPSKLPPARQQAIREAFARLAVPPAPEGEPGSNIKNGILLFRDAPMMGANAITLPNGNIVVTDPLVKLAANDDEVVAVLAHEMGHLSRRHSLRTLIQSSIVSFVVAWYLGDVSSVAAGVPTFLLQAHYSRDFEREADAYGAALLKANGLSPKLLAGMLEKLEAAHQRQVAEESGMPEKDAKAPVTARGTGLGDYMASHPATRERIEALNRM
jgi:Zn-dependent protease with chaperone function